MKKLLISFIALSMSLLAYSQSEHMKFMGIPLTGTINAFQAKLAAKGVKPDFQANQVLEVGVRMFTGDFAGYQANFYVYYDKTTKIVYRAKACITETKKSIFEQRYNDLKSMINTKYDDGYTETGSQEGHETQTTYTDLGVVSLYTSIYTQSYPDQYVIHVDYEDGLNGSKHKKSQLDDI